MNGPEFLIPIIMLISMAVVIIVIRKFINEERMSLIDKGASADLFTRKPLNSSYPALRYGLLLFGAGVGILVGKMMAEAQILDEEGAVFSCLLIFGGAGLFTSYFIEKREAAKKND